MAVQANNQIAPRTGATVLDPTNMKPTQLFTSAAIRKILTSTLQSEQRASIVVATLISILNISPRFQNCNSMELLGNVLRYEIGMGLSWAMDDYAVIDYGGKPTFQLQYQGRAKMALASGKYADGDWYEVREGEYRGLDPRTRRPIIQWIEDDEERNSKGIIGYYVWLQLINEPPYNGKIVSLYMSHDAILRHADTYSQPFQAKGGYKAYKKAMETGQGFVKGNGTGWFAAPDSAAHMKMCKKTVLIQLLKNPFLPKSNGIFDKYAEADDLQERTGEAPTFDDEYTRMAREVALSAAREASTVQIEAPASYDTAKTENAAQTIVEAERANPAPAPVQTAAPEQAPAKRGRPAKKNAEQPAPPSAPAPVQPTMMDFPEMNGDPFPEDDPFEGGNW